MKKNTIRIIFYSTFYFLNPIKKLGPIGILSFLAKMSGFYNSTVRFNAPSNFFLRKSKATNEEFA